MEANQIRQGLVNDWLSGWKKVLNHVWALQRQYGDPEVWFRVTGNAAGAQLIMDRSAEVYDIDLSWDAQNADSEVMLAKMEKIGQILALYDRNGQGNFGEYMKAFIEAVDPNLAARLVMPAQAAANKEIEETSSDGHCEDMERSGGERPREREPAVAYAGLAELVAGYGADTQHGGSASYAGGREFQGEDRDLRRAIAASAGSGAERIDRQIGHGSGQRTRRIGSDGGGRGSGSCSGTSAAGSGSGLWMRSW